MSVYNPLTRTTMVKLRLKQTGKKNARQYRIVAVDARDKRDGKVLEILGTYNPMPNPSKMDLNIESADKWIKNGAQMTERVAKIYKLFKSNEVKA
jgi:small subunit ribosomal protein S16